MDGITRRLTHWEDPLSYRVDNVPLLLQPFFLIYGWGLGLALFLLFVILHFTVRIRISGEENLDPDQAYVFCQWHSYTFPHFIGCLFRYKGSILLNHPAWYMKPIHVVLHLLGIRKLILGSTGHGGRAAANQLVKCLQQGHSTLMFPDGPAGPPFTFFKGTLHLSLQSGCPVVPVRVHCRRRLSLPTWDSKHLPLPFSRLDIRYEKPFQVTEDNFHEAVLVIPELLNEKF
jgi:lysophospholipid acyltransferase (LPLAT)-like uncharacterized protein